MGEWVNGLNKLMPTWLISPIHPFNLFTHSLIHPFTHSPIHPFTHSPIHSFTHSPIHPFTHSPIHSFTHSLIHPFNPFTHLTHSPSRVSTPHASVAPANTGPVSVGNAESWTRGFLSAKKLQLHSS